MKTLYTAHAYTIAGRNGHGETDDKKLSFNFTKPGGDGDGTNPEQLFALGYSACFGSALEAVAKKEGVEAEEIKVEAEVSLHQDDDKGFYLSVVLSANLKGVDQQTAEKLVSKAHHVCPYSKATRGNIEVTLQVNHQKLASAAA